MSLKTIVRRINGLYIDDSWFNDFRLAMTGDLVPRDSTGAPNSAGSALGSATLQFLKAYINLGHFKVGDVKIHHSFNGATPIGNGWMLCDGRQITQANYDTEHGAGTWATYVGSSPILNKYLPNQANRYAIGTGNTTQDGSAALTPVGLANHTQTVSLDHYHQWLTTSGPTTTPDNSFDSSGNPLTVARGGAAKVPGGPAVTTGNGPLTGANHFTNISGAYSPGAVLQPDSIEVQYYMRII